jgi:hypothetical protein
MTRDELAGVILLEVLWREDEAAVRPRPAEWRR